MTQRLSLYLPTVERARTLFGDLPSGEPREIERLTMLVLHAALIRRTSFTDTTVSAPASLERGEPPAPIDFEQRHHVRLDENLGGEGPCMACGEKPGQRRCRVCLGRGKLFDGKTACSCKSGWVKCPTCGGTARTSIVKLRYYTDAPVLVTEAYMPSHVGHVPSLFRLESTMEEDIQFRNPMPEDLRCHDLTGRVEGSAYRGGGRVVRPEFHGHDFGDTIDKALAGLTAVGAGASVVRYDVRAYAWPFLKLSWSFEDPIAIYADRTGALKVFGRAAAK
jgi:hypothetical protein